MSKTLKEVTPFEYTYTVRNLYGGHEIEFKTLEAVYGYVLNQVVPRYVYTSWSSGGVIDWADVSDDEMFATSETVHRHYWRVPVEESKWYTPKYKYVYGSHPFLVKNNMGAVVTADAFRNITPGYDPVKPEILERQKNKDEGRSKRNAHADYVDSLRKIKKGSADKIKYIFGAVHSNYGVWGDGWSNNLTHHHKCRTTNEKRWNEAHDDEYGAEYGVWTRKSRTGRNLPSLWEDPGNASWNTRKSWKHNSKRRKQWKVKDDSSSFA